MGIDWPDRGGWDAALAAHFFPPSGEERPVYFCVDDDALIQIAAANGWEPAAEAPERFVRAIRTHVPPTTKDAFIREVDAADRWFRKPHSERSDAPPYLAVLGVTVLAASHTGNLSKKGTFYHRTLRRLLGLPDKEGETPGYTHVPRLWARLGNWLRDEGGQRGTATAWAPETYWQNIGYSMSQALLRGSERTALVEFFLAIGAPPGADMPPAELALRLLEWSRASGKASERLRGLLEDNDLRPKVAEIASAQLRRWDGSIRDAQGFRVLRLAVTIDLRRRCLGTVLALPDDLGTRSFEVLGQAVHVRAADRWASLAIDLTSDDLLAGRSASTGDIRVALRGAPLHVLVPDDVVGAYVSVNRPEPGREVVVLVNHSVQEDFAVFLHDHALDARPVTKVPLPGDWSCFQGVRLPKVEEVDELPPSLRALAPQRGEIPRLVGGLRLASHAPRYLMGGTPDVFVPALGQEQEVRLDGALLAVVRDSDETIVLEGRALKAGRHEVTIASTKLPFELLPQLAEAHRRPVLAHHLNKTPTGWAAQGNIAAADESADLIVCGATIGGVRSSDLPPVLRPNMVKARAHRYLAVACGCRVAALEVRSPDWFRRAGIELTAFELPDALVRSQVSFDPCFVVRVLKTSVVAVPVGAPHPHDCRDLSPLLRAVNSLRHSVEGDASDAACWASIMGQPADA